MITSAHNDKLKEIRRLHRRSRDEPRFVAEGEDLLAAAHAAGWPAVYELRAGIDVEAPLLADVSLLGSGTRAIGVYERRWASRPAGPLCLALWGVGDPGNVGTAVRAAHAFGAACVALGPGSADPFGARAVRASMGSIFAVPVVTVENVDELPQPRVALAADAAQVLRGPGVGAPAGTLIVGAEREGVPATVAARCDEVARIAIQSESLNAAMAASVALYEWTRADSAQADGPHGEPAATGDTPASATRVAPR